MAFNWFDELGGIVHIDGNLHRSAIPAQPAHYDALKRAGIRVVYSFEEEVRGDALRAHGFDWRPHFWTDDQPPTPGQLDRFLTDYLALPLDTPALIHCRAGWGRTGTAAACALIARHGWSAEQALTHFWSRVPRARPHMERNGQAAFVRGFAARRADRNPLHP